ncbi:MAG: DUF2017 domain-containing protein [Mycobacteriaceae bacterium]
MRKWKRVVAVDGPRFVSVLDSHEVALLKNMATSVQEMLDDRQSGAPTDPLEALTGIRTGNPQAPQDGTMRRLLPDFVKEQQRDAEAANGALRSLHEPQIIDTKIAAAQRLIDTLPAGGGPIELSEDDANAWIAAVNDIRLALGTILGVGPDLPDRLAAGHPMAAHFEVYQWLTVLQEYLVLGLMGKPIR